MSLGTFLRDRRARLAPEATGRRRTPGLRREEVALRAGVSVTWYACLEQGRGGPPSEDMLERLARALELDRAAREMLFLLAQQRPPPVIPTDAPRVSPTLQRVLDAIAEPAMVKTATWDIVAWNKPLLALNDYASMPPEKRNFLRLCFSSGARAHFPDWEEIARSTLAIYRIDVARIGGSPAATALEAELSVDPDFRRLWAENGVRSSGFGTKRVMHPTRGPITYEHSTFPVDGADGLTMIVLTPA